MRLNRNSYWLFNTIGETFMVYDEVDRLVTWLVGKRTNHLLILVVKGQKTSPLLTIDTNDMMELRRELIGVMNSL